MGWVALKFGVSCQTATLILQMEALSKNAIKNIIKEKTR